MADVRQDVALFMNKCDELIASKFILADAKISELLKSITMSKTLCSIFQMVTEEFSYSRAKMEYMAAAPDGSTNRKVLILPEDIYEQAAFIFCLLVDFNKKNIDLARFLQEFYNVDGSITSSYNAFINQLVKPFKNAVRVALKNEKIEIAPAPVKVEEKSGQRELRQAVNRLSKVVSSMVDDPDSKYGMDVLIAAMLDSIDKEDYKNFRALVYGFSFAESYVGIETDELKNIMNMMRKMKV